MSAHVTARAAVAACLVAAVGGWALSLAGNRAEPAPTPITLVAAAESAPTSPTGPTPTGDTWAAGAMPAASSSAWSPAGTTPTATGTTGTWTRPATGTPTGATAPTSSTPDAANPAIPRAGVLTPGTGIPVVPVGETALMPGAQGDVADDVAIWRNPEHPEQSLIVGDNKADAGGGVAVYRLDGSLAQYERTGKIGNVDLRLAGVGDRTVVLVGANDRSNDTIRFWSLDPGTGALTSMEAANLPTGAGNYGFCMGRDESKTHTYAFVTARDSGRVEQYELWARDGRVDAVKVRTFDVGSISEACVVDDFTGHLLIAEEAHGVWQYQVDPSTGSLRTPFDEVGSGHLIPDVEGMAVVRGRDHQGFLLVSSQGDSAFAVYDIDTHTFRGRFSVGGRGSVDGVTGTDGMEAVPGDFGPQFPHGLLVVHDEANDRPSGGGTEPVSNLKLIPLDEVVSLAG